MEYLLKVFGSIDSFAFLGIYIILGWSLYILMFSGQASLGHAAFYAIGAYVSGVATATWGLPLFLAIIVGTIAGAVVGFLFGLPCLRMRGIWLIMATAGLCEIVNVVIKSTDYIGASYGFSVSFQAPMAIIWVAVIFCGIFTWLFVTSRFALACRAVAQDPTSAEHLGIDLTPVKLTAFTISGGMAALAGGLYAHYIAYLYPDAFTVHSSVIMLMWVVLGGHQSYWGPVFGVFVYTYLLEFFEFAGKFREFPFSFLVLLIVLWRPQGLIDKMLILTITRRLHASWQHLFKMDTILRKAGTR